MTDAVRASREQVLAFRQDSHHLSVRNPPAELLEVVGACGVRNTPPGSAPLAMQARLEGLKPEAVDRGLAEDKSLIEVLGIRMSPWMVPSRDAAVFTLGALPIEEQSIRAGLPHPPPAIEKDAIPAREALRMAADAARQELDGRMIARGALSAGMTKRLPETLSRWCQACGSTHLDESLFRLVGVCGVFVIVPASDGSRLYARTDQWLDGTPSGDPESARTELLRRYLGCYGPSTPAHFAAWAGTGASEAQRSWSELGDQLVPIDFEGRRTWLHADDLARFESPAGPARVRLLPPYDAYLDQRDRATLIPDKALQKRVWRILGNPGVVLGNGEVVGLWRQQKKRSLLVVTVEALGRLPRSVRTGIEAEALLLGAFRGCSGVEFLFPADS